MRILIIMPWIRQGGAELIAAETAFFLGKIGHKVKLTALFVDTSDMGERAGQIDYVVPARWISTLCWKSKWFLYFLGPFFLFFLVLKHANEADVLFPHSLPAHWVASVIGKIMRKPVVWLCNEPPARVSLKEAKTLGWADFVMWFIADSFLDYLFVRGVQKIIAYSDSTAEEVAERYGKEPEVVRLGVDCEFFSKEVPEDINRIKEKYRLSNKFVLLAVGKLHPQENQRLVIKVLARLIAKIPRVRLVLVGAGPDEEFLRKQAENLGVKNYIIFAGFCTPKEVRAWYHLCNLVLFPPLSRMSGVKESWGFVPIEALCAGRLSLVSTRSGVAVTLQKEKIGVVVSPRVEDFSRRVLEIYNNPAKFGPLVKKGTSFVRKSLSWESYGRQVDKILRDAL